MDYKIIYDNWLSNPHLTLDGATELNAIKDDEKEIENRFGKELAFGTAGMRGIIGMGTNRMNVYTVARATKGLADFLNYEGEAAKARGVAISYDTRRLSQAFALTAAGVLVAAGVKVHLYAEPRPVPMLSYAVKKLNCAAGIMITASHNPKDYNGYKVYGSDGAQMSPKTCEKVVKFIDQVTDYFAIKVKDFQTIKSASVGGARIIKGGFEKKYYKELLNLCLSKKLIKKEGAEIKLVYTPVHGTGFVPVTTVLKMLKIKASVVEEQMLPDTEFSTVEVPNPEFKETLKMGIDLANKIGADVVFGTDPDCDRLGVAIRKEDNEFTALSGNQVGALLLEYILLRRSQENTLNQGCFVVKSFVSTELARAICDSYGVQCIDTPVGFKYIGEKIKEAEQTEIGEFVFGFEESCGYLSGTHARDKDAVVASMLFAEMVCYYKTKGMTICSVLNGLYEKYGYYLDKTVSISYSGLHAMEEMNDAVEKVSYKKVSKFDIHNVVAVRNYDSGIKTNADGSMDTLEYSKLNCLYYELENGSFICLRPSGTEPKMKIYYSVCAKDKAHAEEVMAKLIVAFEAFLKA